jgi:hypothetical protein
MVIFKKLCTEVVLKKSERKVGNFAEGNVKVMGWRDVRKGAKRVSNSSRACDIRAKGEKKNYVKKERIKRLTGNLNKVVN